MISLRHLLGYVIWVIIVAFITDISSVPFDVTTYHTADGITCFKCPKGQKVEKDCVEDLTNSSCIPCPAHQYMDRLNDQKHCMGCNLSECPANGKKIQNCTATTDFACLCDLGFHRYPLDPVDPVYECRKHTTCKAGHGEVRYGNHSHDTKCEKCVNGQQFVNKSDPTHPKCANCSICPPGSDIFVNCTMSNDTECTNNLTENHITSGTPPSDSDGLDGGAIAGIVITILVIIGAAITICIVKKKYPNAFKCNRRPGAAQNEGAESGFETQIGEKGDIGRPLISRWPVPFIERRVCPFLSTSLGEEWRRFIVALPGWPESVSVHTIIEHKMEEEQTVPNRILGCLKEWMRKADQQHVSKDSIIVALRAVEKNDLVEGLDEMASSFQMENGL